MRGILKIVGKSLLLAKRLRVRAWSSIQCSLFAECGKNVLIGSNCSFTYQTIRLGADVFIAEGAIWHASDSSISVGNKVMFGPQVVIMGGDHRIDVIGKPMFDVREKTPVNDRPVAIEDDVWVGAGAVILKGVRIGRGSIVGAGAVVTRDIPPYSIVVGNAVRTTRCRWTPAEIAEHERIVGLR